MWGLRGAVVARSASALQAIGPQRERRPRQEPPIFIRKWFRFENFLETEFTVRMLYHV